MDLNYISSIDENGDVLADGRKIGILNIEPINFNLKSKMEQRIILESYKTLLKRCDFNFQIYIQTQKASIEKHILEIKNCIKYEPEVAEMAEDYINLIKEISSSKSSISRKFYMIYEKKKDKNENIFCENIIIESLKLCGNIAHQCDENEIIKLFNCCFKKQVSKGVAPAS